MPNVYGVDYQGIQSCLLPTLSLLSVSIGQSSAFATGVPPNICAFHRYTRNSLLPTELKSQQYRVAALG